MSCSVRNTLTTYSQIERIKAEVEQAATAQLHAGDARTALSRYTDDAVAVTNTEVFSSRELLGVNIGEYYRSLEKVNHASWEDIHIQVLDESAATFSARFTYGFTGNDGKTTNLKGVWTALFVLDRGSWKIRLRHESFQET
ncbi:MAG: nuclear transport factor 2 family protein [Bacteroidota bacterium]